MDEEDEQHKLLPTIVASYFALGRRLGGGAFGEVYSGYDTRTGAKVAIKVEPQDAPCPQLVYEARVMQELQGAPGIPRKYWFGSEGDYNILVMQKLGVALGDARISVRRAVSVALQAFDRLQVLHAAGFAHRDIKPENFVYGTGSQQNVLYLIDFGLCKRVVDVTTGVHIEHRKGKHLTGTPRYASLYTHEGDEQSRRDDIESLVFMLLFLIRGTLPWIGVSSKDNYAAVLNLKRSIPIKDLCEELPSCFADTLLYARALHFTSMPDYRHLLAMWSCAL